MIQLSITKLSHPYILCQCDILSHALEAWRLALVAFLLFLLFGQPVRVANYPDHLTVR